MDLCIQNIISKDASALERVEDYHNLIRVLQEEKDVPITFVKNGNAILKTLKQDIQNEDVKVSQDSLHFLGVFLHIESVLSTLDNNTLRDLLDGLCTLIQTTSEKIICTRALWCLSKQKIPMSICLEKIDAILLSLECSSENFKQSSATVELEAIRVLNRFLNELPDNLAVRSEKWARKLYLATVHPSGKVRETALQTLNLARPCFEKHQSELLHKLIPDLKEVLVPGMLKLFKEKQELHALKLWDLLLDILGKTLHQGASLINNLLAVVEKAFKSSATDVKLAAFKSWQHLISNFGSELDVLANPKRLRLVMQPLKANNARAESIAMVKFTVWWHLANSLGPKLSGNLEMVVYPLMQFCFGITESVSNNQTSLNSNGVGTNTTPKGTSNSSSINISPGICHSFPSVHRYGCEALAQILGYGINVPITRPPFTIGMLSHPVISPSSLFLRHSRIFILAVKEAIANLSSEKKDLHLQLYLWHSLIALIRTTSETENIKDLSEVVSTFLNVLEDFVKSSTLSRDVALKLLEAAVQLPSRMLASSALNVGDASVMHGTPALFLVNLLFHGNILKLSITQERFMAVFQKLITIGLNSTSEPLRFIQSITKILDSSTVEIDHSDTIYRLWSTIVFPLFEHVQKTQEINQGDALEHDFSCLYGILLFPIQRLLMKPLLQNSLKTLIRTWGDLYRSFASCAALVVNTEGNIGCEEFSTSILNITTGANFEDPLFLDNLSQLLMIMVTTIDFTPASLINNNNPSATVSPVAWMKRKQKPLGNLTSYITLLEKALMAVEYVQTRTISIDSSDMPQQNQSNYFKISSILMDILKHLYSHITSSILIGPTTSKLASSIAILFSDPSKKDISKIHQGQMMTKLENVWNTITNCIQMHCNGPYDSEFLSNICPLLEVTLLYPKKNIRVKTRMFWHSTFAQRSDNLVFPESFKVVLRKIRPSLVPGFTGDTDVIVDELSGNNSQENDTGNDQSIDKIPSPQKLCSPFRNKMTDENLLAKKKAESPSPVAGLPQRRERIDDLEDKEFVKIAPDPKKRRILTEHQKEMLTNKRDVPALYNDLSQDSNRISSQFIDDTESQSLIPAEGCEDQFIIKEPSEENVLTEMCVENVLITSKDNVNVGNEVLIIESQENSEENVVIIDDSCRMEVETEINSEVTVENSIQIIEIENQASEIKVISLSQDSSSLTSSSVQEITNDENSVDSAKEIVLPEKDANVSLDNSLNVPVESTNIENKQTDTNKDDKNKNQNPPLVEEDKKSTKKEIVDEKLCSQPILEIKKLTEKEILNLSQHNVIDMEENISINKKSEIEMNQEENCLPEGEKLTPRSFVKYISRKKSNLNNSSSASATSSPSVQENEDVIPSSQDTDFCLIAESVEISDTVNSDKEVTKEETISQTDDSLSKEDIQKTPSPSDKDGKSPSTSTVKRKRKRLRSSFESLRSEEHKTGKSRHMRRQLRDLKESPNYVLTRKKKKSNKHLQPNKRLKNISKENKNDDNVESGSSEKGKKSQSPSQVMSSKSPKDDGKRSIQYISDSHGDNKILLIHTSSPKSERKITRKNKTARKSLPASLSASSAGESSLSGRGKRQVKKSLKAILAEETSNVLGRKLRQNSDVQKNKMLRYLKNKKGSTDESSAEKSDPDKSESDSLENSQNTMFESLEIDNLQIPSSGIEMLVKNPILNAVEPEIESVPLIVGDTVEITSRPEGDNASDNEINLYSAMTPVNPNDNVNEKNNGIENNKITPPEPSPDSKEKSNETRGKSKVVAVLFDNKCNLDHDSDSSIETDACITFSSLNESIVENVENGQMIPSPSCPDVYSVEGISIPVTEDVEVTIGDQENIDVDIGATSVLVTDDYSTEKEQVIYVLSEMPETEMGNDDTPAANIIVNTEVEVETLKESPDIKTDVEVESSSCNEENSATETSPKKTKARGKNLKSSATSPQKNSASPKGKRKRGDKKLLDFLHRPEDESLTFIAQRNTKTYSRDNVGRTQSKQLIPKQGSDPLLTMKQKSPLMQRVTSRAVRMLEAAAKRNLNTYEKMKYEQRRSPDRPELEEKLQEDSYPVSSSPPMNEEKSGDSSSAEGVKQIKLPEHLLISPSTSPSSGILKKRKNEGIVSASPSPTYRRRVSFADPLVQDKNEFSHSDWLERSPTNVLQRNLELTKIEENDESKETNEASSTTNAKTIDQIKDETQEMEAETVLSTEIAPLEEKTDNQNTAPNETTLTDDDSINKIGILTSDSEKTDLLESACQKAGIPESVCDKLEIVDSSTEKSVINEITVKNSETSDVIEWTAVLVETANEKPDPADVFVENSTAEQIMNTAAVLENIPENSVLMQISEPSHEIEIAEKQLEMEIVSNSSDVKNDECKSEVVMVVNQTEKVVENITIKEDFIENVTTVENVIMQDDKLICKSNETEMPDEKSKEVLQLQNEHINIEEMEITEKEKLDVSISPSDNNANELISEKKTVSDDDKMDVVNTSLQDSTDATVVPVNEQNDIAFNHEKTDDTAPVDDKEKVSSEKDQEAVMKGDSVSISEEQNVSEMTAIAISKDNINDTICKENLISNVADSTCAASIIEESIDKAVEKNTEEFSTEPVIIVPSEEKVENNLNTSNLSNLEETTVDTNTEIAQQISDTTSIEMDASSVTEKEITPTLTFLTDSTDAEVIDVIEHLKSTVTALSESKVIQVLSKKRPISSEYIDTGSQTQISSTSNDSLFYGDNFESETSSEPKRKKLKLDPDEIVEMTNELHNNLTVDMLRDMSSSRILQLQKQLCEMTLAITSALISPKTETAPK